MLEKEDILKENTNTRNVQYQIQKVMNEAAAKNIDKGKTEYFALELRRQMPWIVSQQSNFSQADECLNISNGVRKCDTADTSAL